VVDARHDVVRTQDDGTIDAVLKSDGGRRHERSAAAGYDRVIRDLIGDGEARYEMVEYLFSEAALRLLRTVHQLEPPPVRLPRDRIRAAGKYRVLGARVEGDDAILPFGVDTRNFPADTEVARQLVVDLPWMIERVRVIVRPRVRPSG